MIKNLVLLFSSILLILLAAEGIIRLAGYKPIYNVYSKPSLFWEYDPIIGWTHSTNTSGVYIGPRPWPVEFSNRININSLGLRGPEVSALPENGIRILFSGDSMVASFEVPYEKTFVYLTGKQLSNEWKRSVDTINAGVRGYGTDQSFLAYKQKWSSLNPDIVVFVHASNDPRNNITLHRMRRPFGKTVFTLNSNGAINLIGTPVDHFPLCSAYRMNSSFDLEAIHNPRTQAICELQRVLIDRSAFVTFIAQTIKRSPQLFRVLYRPGEPSSNTLTDMNQSNQKLPYTQQLTTAIVAEFANTVRALGRKFVLVIERSEWEKLSHEVISPALDKIIFIEDAFEGHNLTSLIFKRDSHYNERGHKLFANHLTKQLMHDF